MIRTLTRRLLFWRGAAALGGVAVAGTASVPAAPAVAAATGLAGRLDALTSAYAGQGAHPDADLIATCDRVVACDAEIERIAAPYYREGRATPHEDARMGALVVEGHQTAERAAAMPATTLAGLRAKAAALLVYSEAGADGSVGWVNHDELLGYSIACDLVGQKAALGPSLVDKPLPAATAPAPVPDAALADIRDQLHALEARFRALPDTAGDGPDDNAAARVIQDEITALIRKANGIPATTIYGLAVKGWMAMGYADTAAGDMALRSLCWDLQTVAGRVGA